MIRFALIAYLSAFMAFGPALCCCNLRQLSSLCADANCCGKSSSGLDVEPHHHHCDGKHQHSHHSKQSENRPTPSKNRDDSPNTPSHDSDDCPCKEQRSNLVSAPGPQAADSHGPLELSLERTLATACLATATNIGLADCRLQAGDDERPALLFGREMLRAFQTLRC